MWSHVEYAKALIARYEYQSTNKEDKVDLVVQSKGAAAVKTEPVDPQK
jgi:hypothetical protein